MHRPATLENKYSNIFFYKSIAPTVLKFYMATLENKYSNIFFYKSIAPTVLKFYMEHDQPPGSQNYKIGSGQYPRWPPLLKTAKITKSTFSPEPLDILG